MRFIKNTFTTSPGKAIDVKSSVSSMKQRVGIRSQVLVVVALIVQLTLVFSAKVCRNVSLVAKDLVCSDNIKKKVSLVFINQVQLSCCEVFCVLSDLASEGNRKQTSFQSVFYVPDFLSPSLCGFPVLNKLIFVLTTVVKDGKSLIPGWFVENCCIRVFDAHHQSFIHVRYLVETCRFLNCKYHLGSVIQ